MYTYIEERLALIPSSLLVMSHNQNQNPDRRQSIEPLLPAPATSSSDDHEHESPVNPNAPLANMGLSYSTAKYIAPLSFMYVFPSLLKGYVALRLLFDGR